MHVALKQKSQRAESQHRRWRRGHVTLPPPSKNRENIFRAIIVDFNPQHFAPNYRREFSQPLWAVYVDLKAAFDSVDCNALCQILTSLGPRSSTEDG